MDNTVPLSIFTALLNQSACQLESFRMVLIGPISCTANDIVEFTQALRRQFNLQEFRLLSSYFAHETLTSSCCCSLSPVLRALAALPSLETVSLKAASKGHLGSLDPHSVGDLCQSQSLQDFSLDNFVLNNHHMERVTQALTTTSTANDTTTTTTTIAAAAAFSKIEDLYLNVSGEMNIDCRMLPKLLQHNKSIRKLQLRLSHQKNVNEFLLNIAAALKHNTTLKELGVFGSLQLNDKVEPVFVEMLESNCVMETLVIPSNYTTGRWREQMDLLLHLNGRGRQRLLRESDSVSRQEWITLFSSVSSDINFVYYYLRIDPLLCNKLAFMH
jgi:hypothetical protein